MSRLYEKFILEYYRQTYPELSVNASQIPWALDNDASGTMLPVMQTDVTIEKGNNVLIIDAKYYSHNTQINFDKHTIHSNNIYQLYAYVKNKESSLKDVPHSVSGMLLYAKTEDEIQPDQDFQLDGNAFSVKTLDLNKDFSSIKEQLDSFIQMYF
jgi:5-methylcytosine-specific restriction enzyme subunit McrC